jgi:heptosyltransferase-2
VSEPSRILVMRLSALGDVLLATPAVRALKKRFPNAAIEWLVEQRYLPLLEKNPHVGALAYEKAGAHAGPAGILRLRSELASRGYDLVVDLQDKPKTRLWSGIGKRTVSMRKRSATQALLTLVGRDPPLTRAHAIDLFLEVLAPLGVEPDGRALELRLSDAMHGEAARALPPGALLGLAPGAGWATKQWAPSRFARLAVLLRERGLTPLLLGGPGDAASLAAVREGIDGGASLRDTAGLSVGGLAAAIARCSLVVANDSGPAHIASALGTPLVALFGPTSQERWRPLSPRSEVVRLELPCAPCSNHGSERCPLGHHDCMEKLEVGAVLEAALRVASKAG